MLGIRYGKYVAHKASLVANDGVCACSRDEISHTKSCSLCGWQHVWLLTKRRHSRGAAAISHLNHSIDKVEAFFPARKTQKQPGREITRANFRPVLYLPSRALCPSIIL